MLLAKQVASAMTRQVAQISSHGSLSLAGSDLQGLKATVRHLWAALLGYLASHCGHNLFRKQRIYIYIYISNAAFIYIYI